MDQEFTVVLTLAFSDATTRNVTFNGVAATAINNIKPKILTINANMPPTFAATFISKIGAPCTMISKAKITQVTEEVIYRAS